MTLTEIAVKYPTDKNNHGYMPHYEKHLPEQCRYLLEIGAAKGASALMWKDYYPECDIHLLDLFKDTNHVGTKWCRENFFVPHRGDQSDLNVLSAITEQFEIIIDDGSHRADHQLISFKHLFVTNIVSGGIYAIEDCHCNRDPFYNGDGQVKCFEDTALHLFKTFKDTGLIINPYFSDHAAEQFAGLIDRVEIVADDKLILIWRK